MEVIVPPNQSNPNLFCIASNPTRREAAGCLFAKSGVGRSEMVAVGVFAKHGAWESLRLSASVVRPSRVLAFGSSVTAFAFSASSFRRRVARRKRICDVGSWGEAAARVAAPAPASGALRLR